MLTEFLQPKLKTLKIALTYAVLLLFLTGCIGFGGIDGNGNVVKQTLSVDEFSSISVSGHYTLYLSQGEEASVVLEADENLHNIIDISVESGKLIVTSKESIGDAKALNVIVTNPDFDALEMSGAVEIVGETLIKSKRLKLEGSGASDIDLEIDTEELKIDISGAANVILSGTSQRAEFDLSGAADIQAKDLMCDFLEIDMSGAGDATVYATEELSVDISGAASCRYYGNPKVETDISGAGNVKKAGP